METIQKIDQRITKKSHMRHVSYGNFEELFIYEKPFFYNHSPITKTKNDTRINDTRRADNLYSAREKINRLVLGNTDWNYCAPRFITFTFAENITSLKEANIYWQQFVRKFKERFGQRKYLVVVEFQKRGAVHYHALFFDLKFKKGIRDEIATLWGKGFIKFKSAKKIGSIEHLGLYLAKYLQKDIIDVRLMGEKAFFTSKNLIQPIVIRDENTCYNVGVEMIEKGAIVEEYVSSMYGTVKKYKLNNHVDNH